MPVESGRYKAPKIQLTKVTLYCDGSCPRQHKVGGWAWVDVRDGVIFRYNSGGVKDGATNQRMEILAVTRALEELHEWAIGSGIEPKMLDVEVVSDSAYVVNCIEKGWYVKWQKNGWKNSQGEPVANKDLWVRLLAALDKLALVKFTHIKGHQNNPVEGTPAWFNAVVDALAGQYTKVRITRGEDGLLRRVQG